MYRRQGLIFVNPNFYKTRFNRRTINSIFVLINRDSVQASDSLAKFSSLLRYQLYECNEKEIPLNRELAYLESFIELDGGPTAHRRSGWTT